MWIIKDCVLCTINKIFQIECTHITSKIKNWQCFECCYNSLQANKGKKCLSVWYLVLSTSQNDIAYIIFFIIYIFIHKYTYWPYEQVLRKHFVLITWSSKLQIVKVENLEILPSSPSKASFHQNSAELLL